MSSGINPTTGNENALDRARAYVAANVMRLPTSDQVVFKTYPNSVTVNDELNAHVRSAKRRHFMTRAFSDTSITFQDRVYDEEAEGTRFSCIARTAIGEEWYQRRDFDKAKAWLLKAIQAAFRGRVELPNQPAYWAEATPVSDAVEELMILGDPDPFTTAGLPKL